MKLKQSLLLSLFLLASSLSFSQDIYKRNQYADVKNYVFNLELSDENNQIKGEAIISVEMKDGPNKFALDLIGKSGKFGMDLISVYEEDSKADYNYSNNKITITPRPNGANIRSYKIKYQGIPKEGLVIDTTKFGQRSFFGDNWPTLARHWLPCVDHPYDKASVEFQITAPDHYDVLATGKKIEESNLGDGLKLTVYREPTPVAMKVVTIGVTKFASLLLDTVHNINVSAWVYPENRKDGFSDYSVAVDVLEFFIENIGPYPYAKLANMQAKTKWGGLENAGTISYFENSVTGKNTIEGLIAHEIAHQWFGNSVTENSWNHVWLSEGFATYFTILYQENKYGNEKRKEELEIDRKQIIEYYKKNPSSIVDQSIKDPKKVLSANTYQKAGWVLNMLRHKIGDELFWVGIRSYYEIYRDGNAMTIDFRKVMEEVSGIDLQDFFSQWIFTKGYPEIQWDWAYQDGQLTINIKQVQEHFTFQFPMEIGIIRNGEMEMMTTSINGKSVSLELSMEQKPDDILIDPESWLLFEEKDR